MLLLLLLMMMMVMTAKWQLYDDVKANVDENDADDDDYDNNR